MLGEGRLLLRTAIAGKCRIGCPTPLTGFSLLVPLRALSFPNRTHGFALGDATACTAGQVRASVGSGRTWTALPARPG